MQLRKQVFMAANGLSKWSVPAQAVNAATELVRVLAI